jgi:hypothetical protein
MGGLTGWVVLARCAGALATMVRAHRVQLMLQGNGRGRGVVLKSKRDSLKLARERWEDLITLQIQGIQKRVERSGRATQIEL